MYNELSGVGLEVFVIHIDQVPGIYRKGIMLVHISGFGGLRVGIPSSSYQNESFVVQTPPLEDPNNGHMRCYFG